MRVLRLLLVALALPTGTAAASEPGTGYELEPPDRAACPADPVMLNDLVTPEGFRYEGTTESQDSHGEGLCGGGAGDVVHRLVAPGDGNYQIQVTGAGPGADAADPVVYVRTVCGAAGRELACSDDAPDGTLLPALDLWLDAGDTVDIFVDGYLDEDTGAWRGGYALVVLPQLVAGPVEGPFVHVCDCPDGRRITACSETGCETTEVCDLVCGTGPGESQVEQCGGGFDGCRTPDPLPGPGLLSCACTGGHLPLLPVENALCETLDESPTNAAAVQCAAWCNTNGGQGGNLRTLCDRDSKLHTEARICPNAETGGVYWDPRVICSFEDAAALDCGGAGGGGSPDGAFYLLEGCGCGCASTDQGCPDPRAPGVTYQSHDPEVCTLLNFQCPDGETRFNRPFCGCGCEAPPLRHCPDPSAPRAGGEGIDFRQIVGWAACQEDASWSNACVPGVEELWSVTDCGCGCTDPGAAALVEGDRENPTFFATNYPCNGGFRCPASSRLFSYPAFCGCDFDTGSCPERDVAARVVSDDYQTCRAFGVDCPEGEYPYLHPVCGCGCIPNGVVP